MGNNRFFEYPFDFKQYIRNCLRRLPSSDLEEKRMAKTILEDGLLQIINETEKKYAALEKRVYEEVSDGRVYTLRMTVCSKDFYEPTNSLWFPVDEADVGAQRKTVEEALQSETVSDGARVGRFFFAVETESFPLLRDSHATCAGVLKTTSGTYPAEFLIKISASYRDRVKALYRAFQQNGIPWVTAPMEYLDHFCDVLLKKIHGEAPPDAEIVGFELSYEDCGAYIHTDWMPIWNVAKIRYSCSQFPMPCVDTVNYEHEFPSAQFGEESSYLIEAEGNRQIVGIRREAEKLFVITPEEVFSDWNAYKIVVRHPTDMADYSHPILTNEKKKSFIGGFIQAKSAYIQTENELKRRIYELGREEFVLFRGAEIIRMVSPLARAGSYMAGIETAAAALPKRTISAGWNWFIGDDFFDTEHARVLLLKFKPVRPENYLNPEIVRFIVSELQQYQTEYHCLGVLEE